jgi:hypothetical protein
VYFVNIIFYKCTCDVKKWWGTAVTVRNQPW